MASNLKRAVRARMAVTGETYTQARAALLAPQVEQQLRRGIKVALDGLASGDLRQLREREKCGGE